MNFQAKASDVINDTTDCAVVAVFKDGKLSAGAQAVNKACHKIVQQLIKQKDITGKPGKTTWLHGLDGIKAKRILLLGAGAQSGCSEADYQRLIKGTAEALKGSGCENAVLHLDDINVKIETHSGDDKSTPNRDTAWKAQQAVEVFGSTYYQFNAHKSKKSDPVKLKKVTLAVADAKQRKTTQAGIKAGAAVTAGANLARDLGNHPGNVCTPTYLAAEARRLARNQPRLTTKILQEKQMRELGMHSLLSVAAGTEEPAQMIIMEYKGAAKSKAPYVLVGKGITFDSGGISLKPGAAMDEMKFDMCGAASVFGAMRALLDLQPTLNVVAVVVASENMPSGRATKPGDIVTSMSGQTIEILNTDAEGRLVLCDALTYVERYKPEAVIDVATLTGACVIALGKHATGLYSNRHTLAQALLAAGREAADKAWHMPLWDEYQKQLDSNFADMANIGGAPGGSVTAACFLSRFAKKYPWAHLDIAGTAWLSGNQKGATGRPVPLLVRYLLDQV
ncbi:leucyl aminopeptidase [Exilibacterium tricleocarpae]|uniref:Probable cytosol aminopeptidase n=1 Tax=Exilibacterium tricleocarpae TaxID=2591008 RepID=A0A545U882_9GAMM|nr:leucyl aminopeptidase [Exilibacterium tricleocarpae]TQV85671.1 leucyl aminopeptidase [Exilibacterium tricleocarpae]